MHSKLNSKNRKALQHNGLRDFVGGFESPLLRQYTNPRTAMVLGFFLTLARVCYAFV